MEGSFGLCVLEEMALSVPTTVRALEEDAALHVDPLRSLARQYPVAPHAFAMGAAMAGLLPKNVKEVRVYPEQGDYCRAMSQNLQRRPYRIRLAETSDLDELVRLEALAWSEQLRAPREVLARRLQASPTTVFVCEMGDKLVAVLYTQKVSSEDDVDNESFMDVSAAHDPAGRIVQLIAIGSDPQVAHLGIGSELRCFALHHARLDPEIDAVIAVTRCQNFSGGADDLEAYVQGHIAGEVTDQTLNFHTSFGAEIVRLVPDYRPEDVANHATGVLIRYRPKEWVCESSIAGKPKLRSGVRPLTTAKKQVGSSSQKPKPSIEVVKQVMEELGHKVDPADLQKGFFSYGMDSLDLVRVQKKLQGALSMTLPDTLLLDYPNVQDLCKHLDEKQSKRIKPPSSAALGSHAAVAKVMSEVGFQLDESDLTRGFLNYGMDSLELVRIKKRLQGALAMDLPDTLLLDYPNAKALIEYLDMRKSRQHELSNGKGADSSGRRGWDTLKARELAEVLRRCNKKLSLPQYQKKFGDLYQKHHPKKDSYMSDIDAVLADVEGQVLAAFDLVADTGKETVEESRQHMAACMKKFSLIKEVKASIAEYTRLTKMADSAWK